MPCSSTRKVVLMLCLQTIRPINCFNNTDTFKVLLLKFSFQKLRLVYFLTNLPVKFKNHLDNVYIDLFAIDQICRFQNLFPRS